MYWANLQQGLYAGHYIDLKAFQHRVVSAVDRVIDAHGEDDRVAIICHGGVISAYLASVMGNSQPLFFEPEYTSISACTCTRWTAPRTVGKRNSPPGILRLAKRPGLIR